MNATQPTKSPPGVASATVAALILLLLLTLALAPRAQAFIYWPSLDSRNIGRSNLNGAGVDPNFISRVDPVGVSVDADHIYWTSQNGKIGRARIDGSRVDRNFIKAPDPSQASRIALAVDAEHIYWTDGGATGAPGKGRIGRANLDGTGVREGFVTGANLPSSIAVDNAHIYWTNYTGGNGSPVRTSLGRANLDGTGVDQEFIGDPVFDVAAEAGHIYWMGSGSIGRANPDGTGIDRRFISRIFGFSDVATGAGYIYWSSWAGPRIDRADLDGKGVERRFAKVPVGPFDLAVDELRPPGRVTANRTQIVSGSRVRVEVKIKAKDDLTARAGGNVAIRGRTYKLERKRRRVAAGKVRVLTLRPKRTNEEFRIAKALRRSEIARASVNVKLTGRVGNSKTVSKPVRLKSISRKTPATG